MEPLSGTVSTEMGKPKYKKKYKFEIDKVFYVLKYRGILSYRSLVVQFTL